MKKKKKKTALKPKLCTPLVIHLFILLFSVIIVIYPSHPVLMNGDYGKMYQFTLTFLHL